MLPAGFDKNNRDRQLEEWRKVRDSLSIEEKAEIIQTGLDEDPTTAVISGVILFNSNNYENGSIKLNPKIINNPGGKRVLDMIEMKELENELGP